MPAGGRAQEPARRQWPRRRGTRTSSQDSTDGRQSAGGPRGGASEAGGRSTGGNGQRPGTGGRAAGAVTAVRRANWYSPGRTACLEESVAAVLLLAARRLGVRWCHGIASDPVRLHAWVQTVDGADVAEPSSTRAYTPALTIGGPHHHPRRPG